MAEAVEEQTNVTTVALEQPPEATQISSPVEAQTLTLRLRPRPSVTWGADVINNEGMGKKSSKRECTAASSA